MIHSCHPDLFGPILSVNIDVGGDCKNLKVLYQVLESVRFTHLIVIRKNFLGGGEPVHDWHSYIHQDEVVDNLATTLSQIEFDLVVCLKSIVGSVCLDLELTLQYLLQRIYVELTIVDNQDSSFTLATDLNKVWIR